MKTVYLYVKAHRQTGLKYFGKTTRDPFKYHGSGKYWTRHLKLHGTDVDTMIVGAFDSETSCRGWAKLFSKFYDIANSDKWANLREENGFDGAPVGHDGHIFNKEERLKIAAASKSMWQNTAVREKIIEAQKAAWNESRRASNALMASRQWTDERKKAHSERIRELRKTKANWGTSKGIPKTEAHKRKISQALKGRKKTTNTAFSEELSKERN